VRVRVRDCDRSALDGATEGTVVASRPETPIIVWALPSGKVNVPSPVSQLQSPLTCAD
jgi:hypothetical protein